MQAIVRKKENGMINLVCLAILLPLGALVMAFGGLLSMSDPRIRKKRQPDALTAELVEGAAP